MMGQNNEQVLWEGNPTWRAWAFRWLLGWGLFPLFGLVFAIVPLPPHAKAGFVLPALLVPATLALVLVVPVWTRMKSRRWKLTTRRVEVERGLLSKQVDTLELWRVRDVELRQSLSDRIFGVACLVVTANDAGLPALEIRGVPGDRSVYDKLMAAVMEVRQQRGIVNVGG